MAPETFEQTLRQFLRREPFQPFIIEFLDGKQLFIDAPHTVSIGTHLAGFITPEYDIYRFRCEETRDIRLASQQPIS